MRDVDNGADTTGGPVPGVGTAMGGGASGRGVDDVRKESASTWSAGERLIRSYFELSEADQLRFLASVSDHAAKRDAMPAGVLLGVRITGPGTDYGAAARDDEKREERRRHEAMESAARRRESQAFVRENVTLQNFQDAMTFQPWDEGQQRTGRVVAEYLRMTVQTLLEQLPAGRWRDSAVEDLLVVRMKANAAITFRGRF